MRQSELTHSQTLSRLDALAQQSLPLWEVPADARVQRINDSENTTYLVAAEDYRAILRIHREVYHSRRAIECELAWMDALNATGRIVAPDAYAGRDGQRIQTGRHPELPAPRFMVLFHFIDGTHPREDGDLTAPFRQLGQIAARAHDHAQAWKRPQPFERLRWDAGAVFGAAPTWGNWRDAPNVTAGIRATLENVDTLVRARLARYGKSPERFGLIHADMRLANVLMHRGAPRVIDFDDCGLGWFMYDFAAAISFIEDHPAIPALRTAWLEGYRSEKPLAAADEHEIDTFVMLRRMALLAWIGSHIDAPEPQAMAPHFAEGTARLGRAYLATMAD